MLNPSDALESLGSKTWSEITEEDEDVAYADALDARNPIILSPAHHSSSRSSPASTHDNNNNEPQDDYAKELQNYHSMKTQIAFGSTGGSPMPSNSHSSTSPSRPTASRLAGKTRGTSPGNKNTQSSLMMKLRHQQQHKQQHHHQHQHQHHQHPQHRRRQDEDEDFDEDEYEVVVEEVIEQRVELFVQDADQHHGRQQHRERDNRAQGHGHGTPSPNRQMGGGGGRYVDLDSPQPPHVQQPPMSSSPPQRDYHNSSPRHQQHSNRGRSNHSPNRHTGDLRDEERQRDGRGGHSSSRSSPRDDRSSPSSASRRGRNDRGGHNHHHTPSPHASPYREDHNRQGGSGQHFRSALLDDVEEHESPLKYKGDLRDLINQEKERLHGHGAGQQHTPSPHRPTHRQREEQEEHESPLKYKGDLRDLINQEKAKEQGTSPSRNAQHQQQPQQQRQHQRDTHGNQRHHQEEEEEEVYDEEEEYDEEEYDDQGEEEEQVVPVARPKVEEDKDSQKSRMGWDSAESKIKQREEYIRQQKLKDRLQAEKESVLHSPVTRVVNVDRREVQSTPPNRRRDINDLTPYSSPTPTNFQVTIKNDGSRSTSNNNSPMKFRRPDQQQQQQQQSTTPSKYLEPQTSSSSPSPSRGGRGGGVTTPSKGNDMPQPVTPNNNNNNNNSAQSSGQDEPIVGTCSEYEKKYLRLTTKPEASKIRPQSILEKWFPLLIRKYKMNKNYDYTVDQLKSIRQDLVVQHIRNAFTLEVYESNAIISLENNDFQEFGQCITQIKELYSGPTSLDSKFKYEFISYDILFTLLYNQEDLHPLLSEIDPEILSNEIVHHSFKRYFLDKLLSTRVRDNILAAMVKSYKPHIRFSFLEKQLLFDENKPALISYLESKEWVLDMNQELCMPIKKPPAPAAATPTTAK
ncbi:hypothetical protein SAMD00019534_092690 [Acytostelium subglobosum LB1]|uniref:hypothetical protein n=1 Tax=Acytostelium subglobosum LB1 TaxID=1410327 RepID=UPI00064499BA|nr:hypothetical protein SAMD00019534_092690 [Acytostelium subglobosum LB1]GAM26094.1 hypothetical protein SAMD00019534_092690 [Acytostelium subglobosum LB1]|eukprot:XP_012751137.1 hypothetical protein SAMD00019534_092690 [Acytostelium subglobosum LB1]